MNEIIFLPFSSLHEFPVTSQTFIIRLQLHTTYRKCHSVTEELKVPLPLQCFDRNSVHILALMDHLSGRKINLAEFHFLLLLSTVLSKFDSAEKRREKYCEQKKRPFRLQRQQRTRKERDRFTQPRLILGFHLTVL